MIATLVLVTACGPPQSPGPAPSPRPAVEPTTVAAGLRRTAETQYLPRLASQLAELIRQQPWFQELTQPQLELVAAIQKCEAAAQRRGETASVLEMLRYASEQSWYQDGLDDRESIALAAIFDAYAKSLSDENAPAIGRVLSTTLRFGLFETLKLAESGDLVLLVSSDRRDLGRRTLEIAIDTLPKVEQIAGKFPYRFLHLEVTDELPLEYAGVSYNEFIEIRTDYVDAPTIVHEVTHSTLYGIFPTWFEEGLAHFIEYYLTASLSAGVRDYTGELRALSRDPRLDLRPNRAYSFRDELAERAQGFLLLKGLFDIQGIEGLSATIRSLRTRTFSDQELLRAIVQQAGPDLQPQVRRLLCQGVVGATTNFCAPP